MAGEKMGFNELHQRAQSGDAEAMRKVAMAYLKGEGVDQDLSKAIEWTDRAAELGDVEAMSDMASIYRKAKRNEDAFLWEEKAANLGRAESMYNLSVCYRDGLGVPADRAKHLYWYEQGKANGFPPAGYKETSELDIDSLLQLVREAQENRDLKAVLNYSKRIQVEMPDNWEINLMVRLSKGALYLQDGEWDKVFSELRGCTVTPFELIEKASLSGKEYEAAVMHIYKHVTEACEIAKKRAEAEYEEVREAFSASTESHSYSNPPPTEVLKREREAFKEGQRVKGARDAGIAEVYHLLSLRILGCFGTDGKLGECALKAHIQAGYKYQEVWERAREVVAKGRYDEFWAANQELKAKLESEKSNLQGEIAAHNAEISAIPARTEGYPHMVELQKQVQNLTGQKKELGFFSFITKRNERKEFNQQIDAVKAEIAPIQARIDAAIAVVQALIVPLAARVTEIDNELTKPR